MSEITNENVQNAQPVVSENTPKKKRRGWLIALILLVVLAVAGVAGFEGWQRVRIEKVIASAHEKLGLPYRLGALGPYDYDCSSLVQVCFADAGVETPRLAAEIGYSEAYRKIDTIDELLRGDIVCWDTVTDDDLCDHVGIYLGGGEVLHASSGQMKVMISSMEGYFTDKFSWGLRPIEHLPVELPFDFSQLVQPEPSQEGEA